MPKPAKKAMPFIKGSGPGGAVTEAEALAHNRAVDALKEGIDKAAAELFHYLGDDDTLHCWMQDKVYDLLPALFAADKTMETKPHNVPLEFLYQKIFGAVITDPTKKAKKQ